MKRSRTIKRLLVFLLGFLPAGNALAQVTVTAELDSTHILIGDQTQLRLSIRKAPEANIQQIDWSVLDTLSGIEVLNMQPSDTLRIPEGYLLEHRLTITSFDSGYHWIPAITVRYSAGGQSGSVSTHALPLYVSTYPIQTDSLALQPIKPIIEERLKLQDILPFIAGALFLAGLTALLVWWVRRKKKAEEVVPEPWAVVRPAHEEALEKLRSLRQARLWQKGDIKGFQSELTFILREYLENRFHFQALESTTAEIAKELKKLKLDESWLATVNRVLHVGDLVKFAKAEPPPEVHEQGLEETEAFIHVTKEVEAEEPVPEKPDEETH